MLFLRIFIFMALFYLVTATLIYHKSISGFMHILSAFIHICFNFNYPVKNTLPVQFSAIDSGDAFNNNR